MVMLGLWVLVALALLVALLWPERTPPCEWIAGYDFAADFRLEAVVWLCRTHMCLGDNPPPKRCAVATGAGGTTHSIPTLRKKDQ